MILPVILAGGSGTRLWPLSRALYPKQLLPLINDKTMLQNTVSRVAGQPDFLPPLVICNVEHRFMVAEQLREIDSLGSVMIEPVGRNTAPAVAVAAFMAVDQGEDPILLVLPADHVIREAHEFLTVALLGAQSASAGGLITFGIVPDGPETGYGYIKYQAQHPAGHETSRSRKAHPVERFVEKPDLKSAESYVKSGEYLWNSGMFMFKASRYLEELAKYAPAMVEKCRLAVAGRAKDLDFIRLENESFSQCPSDSIDYAVMEKTDAAMVIPLDCGWSDVGAWSAVWEVGEQDKEGNVIKGNVLTHEVNDCYINATHRMVAAVGVRDLVIVETADAILVSDKANAQDVKKIVEQLKKLKRGEANLHRKVYRPWGSYECVDSEQRFQVKRITVRPGAKLSMQMHHHRAEHWIVVKGTARITVGESELFITENQSTYIPVGAKHRLENPGSIPLELIEVQSGSYLGEDDIVRFEDTYGRAD